MDISVRVTTMPEKAKINTSLKDKSNKMIYAYSEGLDQQMISLN